MLEFRDWAVDMITLQFHGHIIVVDDVSIQLISFVLLFLS